MGYELYMSLVHSEPSAFLGCFLGNTEGVFDWVISIVYLTGKCCLMLWQFKYGALHLSRNTKLITFRPPSSLCDTELYFANPPHLPMFTITVKRDIKVYACAYKNTVVGKSAKWILRKVPGALRGTLFFEFLERSGNSIFWVRVKFAKRISLVNGYFTCLVNG